MKLNLIIGGGVLLGFILVFLGISFFPDNNTFNVIAPLVLIVSLILLFARLIFMLFRIFKQERENK